MLNNERTEYTGEDFAKKKKYLNYYISKIPLIFFKGWSSAYSVSSILLQLQSFLFVKPSEETDSREIKSCIFEANSFKCTRCDHRP